MFWFSLLFFPCTTIITLLFTLWYQTLILCCFASHIHPSPSRHQSFAFWYVKLHLLVYIHARKLIVSGTICFEAMAVHTIVFSSSPILFRFSFISLLAQPVTNHVKYMWPSVVPSIVLIPTYASQVRWYHVGLSLPTPLSSNTCPSSWVNSCFRIIHPHQLLHFEIVAGFSATQASCPPIEQIVLSPNSTRIQFILNHWSPMMHTRKDVIRARDEIKESSELYLGQDPLWAKVLLCIDLFRQWGQHQKLHFWCTGYRHSSRH